MTDLTELTLAEARDGLRDKSFSAQELAKAIEQTGTFGAFSVAARLVAFTDAKALRAVLDAEKPKILYLAPELDEKAAQGVVEASRQVGVKVPVVVRLEGTNKDEGATILRTSGLNFTVAEGMKDAAEKVVALASGRGKS